MMRLLILSVLLVLAATACGQDDPASTQPALDRDALAPVVDGEATCEQVMERCERQLEILNRLLNQIRTQYSENPSPGLLNALQELLQRYDEVKTRCEGDIKHACG